MISLKISMLCLWKAPYIAMWFTHWIGTCSPACSNTSPIHWKIEVHIFCRKDGCVAGGWCRRHGFDSYSKNELNLHIDIKNKLSFQILNQNKTVRNCNGYAQGNNLLWVSRFSKLFPCFTRKYLLMDNHILVFDHASCSILFFIYSE